MTQLDADVDAIVIGGGPAGLAAAVDLARAGRRVTVFEREPAVGGIARHVDHSGYGVREFGRIMRGSRYAHAWAERADAVGIDVRTSTTVTGWTSTGGVHTVNLTSPAGIDELSARAIVLATGTRERPRSARLVPGDRPPGVLTTGSLQRLVAAGLPVGRRAIVVGAEHVSFSAVLTLAHAHCRAVAVVTDEARHQTFAPLAWATTGIRRVPVVTNTTVTRINGTEHVEAVELTDVRDGSVRHIECDTIVFTGDWFPDHELARRHGITMDRHTLAPRVDGSLRTSVPGVFAAGNLLHGAETASVCARSGEWVARSMVRWFEHDHEWPHDRAVPIECEAPLRWTSPSAVVPGEAAIPHGHLLARGTAFLRKPRIVVSQGERELWTGRLRRMVPNIPLHLPTSWIAQVDGPEPVRITVAG